MNDWEDETIQQDLRSADFPFLSNIDLFEFCKPTKAVHTLAPIDPDDDKNDGTGLT